MKKASCPCIKEEGGIKANACIFMGDRLNLHLRKLFGKGEHWKGH